MKSPAGWLVALLTAAPASAASQPLTPADLDYLVREAEAWIVELREVHRPHGRPLTADEKRRLGPFFPPGVVDGARIRRVAGIANPDFSRFFRRRGEPDPIDFSRMTALAAIDTVLVVETRATAEGADWRGLLFHELVHYTQRHVLGERYTESYVRGWATSGSYRGIPAEAQAYELAARFRAAPERVFSVEEEVRRLARELLASLESETR